MHLRSNEPSPTLDVIIKRVLLKSTVRSAFVIYRHVILKNLMHHVEDVRVSLLNFAKENHCVRSESNNSSQLTTLSVTNITRRWPNQFGDCVSLIYQTHVAASMQKSNINDLTVARCRDTSEKNPGATSPFPCIDDPSIIPRKLPFVSLFWLLWSFLCFALLCLACHLPLAFSSHFPSAQAAFSQNQKKNSSDLLSCGPRLYIEKFTLPK